MFTFPAYTLIRGLQQIAMFTLTAYTGFCRGSPCLNLRLIVTLMRGFAAVRHVHIYSMYGVLQQIAMFISICHVKDR